MWLNKKMVWTGDNTEEVVNFCASWEYELCRIYNIYNNLITGVLTLDIELADTMRGYPKRIPLGAKVIRREKNHHRFIEVKEDKNAVNNRMRKLHMRLDEMWHLPCIFGVGTKTEGGEQCG